MRHTGTTITGAALFTAETHLQAADLACNNLPCIVHDSEAGNPWPFTAWHAGSGAIAAVGNPYKTRAEAEADLKLNAQSC